jgi:hypothetical protein
VTSEHLSYEMGFWNVEGSTAYAVISGTLNVTIKGQSVVRTGTLRTRSLTAMAIERLRRRLGAVRRSPFYLQWTTILCRARLVFKAESAALSPAWSGTPLKVDLQQRLLDSGFKQPNRCPNYPRQKETKKASRFLRAKPERRAANALKSIKLR